MSVTMIEEAVKSILALDAGVAAIVSGRIYPVELPQDPEYPLVLYTKVTGERDHCLQGATGKAHPRFQIEAWAVTYAGAKALANAIRNALDDYTGTVGTVKIGSCLIQSENDMYEPDVKCYRIIMDFMIWHSE